MHKPIVFLGTSPNLEIFVRVCTLRGIPIAGIVDSDYYGNTDTKNGFPILGGEDSFDFETARDHYDFFVGMSWSSLDPRSKSKRLAYIDLIDSYQLNCATLIHPNSEVYDEAEIGPGCYIGFNSGVAHYAKIGAHCRLHNSTLVAHHTTIGKNCILHEFVKICSKTTVGNNVLIHPDTAVVGYGKFNNERGPSIGDNAELHPRITVTRDVEPGEIVSLAGGNNRRIYGEVIRS
jgi:acetyltransferase-like isoleucine patch superfamily enzyme